MRIGWRIREDPFVNIWACVNKDQFLCTNYCILLSEILPKLWFSEFKFDIQHTTNLDYN